MSSNTYQDIIKLAIQDEIDAFEFYNSVAKTLSDPSLKQIFEELAQEEQKHRQTLEGLMNNPVKLLKFREVSDYKIAETVALPQLSIEMKPADAIALAMKKEEEAMNAYSEFAKASTQPDQAKIFDELALMERGHKTKLENLYSSMAFPEAW